MEYHRTKDNLYVKERLGHRNIQSTLIYTHLVNFEDDEYTVRVSKDLDEAIKLLETGFEYVTDYNNRKVFKKKESIHFWCRVSGFVRNRVSRRPISLYGISGS